MPCRECEAFLAAFTMATERFFGARDKFDEMPRSLPRGLAFERQRAEVVQARLDYQMALAALKVHKQGH